MLDLATFTKLKTLDDFQVMEAPLAMRELPEMVLPSVEQRVLRMLVKPKYSVLPEVPLELNWLRRQINWIMADDLELTGISNSWCYVTVRHGIPQDDADTWHLDGGSLRVELIPERNYVWTSDGFQYKTGPVQFPDDFDPVRQDMFTHIGKQLKDAEIKETEGGVWNLLTPFCFHRRRPGTKHRTFIRVTFPDIEIRDCNNTQNPLLPTEAFGRDPVRSFRDKLLRTE